MPLPSPASGFTYKFDSATGTFVRSTNSFGPILSDRAETIGRGRLAFGFSHQFFSFDHLDGVRLTAVPAVFRHDNFQTGGGRADVVSTTNSIEATVSQFTGALTYGITDRVDVSLAVPIVRTRLSLLSNATIYRLGTGTNVQVHYFRDDLAIGGYGSSHQYFIEGSAGGLGDLLVRVKTTLMREGPRAFAAGVDVRLPTGDEQNLLGAGAPGVRPFAAFSASYRAFAPHANLSYQWNGRSVLAGDVRNDIEAPLPISFSTRWAATSASTTASASSSTCSASGCWTRRGFRRTRSRRAAPRQRRSAGHPVREWILLESRRSTGLQGQRRGASAGGFQSAFQPWPERLVRSHCAPDRSRVGVLSGQSQTSPCSGITCRSQWRSTAKRELSNREYERI